MQIRSFHPDLSMSLPSVPRVLYEGKERRKPGFQVLDTTPYSHSANLAPPGPGHPRTYLMYRRAVEGAGLHALGITDLCLILPSKGEGTPHTYCRLPRNLNPGMVSGAVVLRAKTWAMSVREQRVFGDHGL